MPYVRHLIKELWPKGFTPKTCHLTKGPWYLLSARDTHEEIYERTRMTQDLCSYSWVFSLTSTAKTKPAMLQDSRHNPQGMHRSRRNVLHRAEANRAKFKMPKMLKEFTLTHRSSLLESPSYRTLHELLARLRGTLEHHASGALTSPSLKLPPALLSHCSGIPQRRSHSAKRWVQKA